MANAQFDGLDFSYAPVAGDAGEGEEGQAGAPSLAIHADRAHLRASLKEDAAAAGLRVHTVGSLEEFYECRSVVLPDIVLLDCPVVDARRLAAFATLDQRAAACGARLIVSTSVEALDDIFACMDQSDPVLLVEPSRAERVIALGQVLASWPDTAVRELSEQDRMMMLRLSEQVSQIASHIDRFAPLPSLGDAGSGGAKCAGPAQARSAFGFGARTGSEREVPEGRGGAAHDLARLPPAQLVRQIIRQRHLRARFFDGDLFADPAWEMLLDLTAARVEGKRVSVTSLCIASGVPPTTALRWIGQMTEAGLFLRICDDSDRRRAFIELSDHTLDAMARYFQELALVEAMPV